MAEGYFSAICTRFHDLQLLQQAVAGVSDDVSSFENVCELAIFHALAIKPPMDREIPSP
jgi:hypothetical protein